MKVHGKVGPSDGVFLMGLFFLSPDSQFIVFGVTSVAGQLSSSTVSYVATSKSLRMTAYEIQLADG